MERGGHIGDILRARGENGFFGGKKRRRERELAIEEARTGLESAYSELGDEMGVNVFKHQVLGVQEAERSLVRLGASDLSEYQEENLVNGNLIRPEGRVRLARFFLEKARDFELQAKSSIGDKSKEANRRKAACRKASRLISEDSLPRRESTKA